MGRTAPQIVIYDPAMGLGRLEFYAHPACFSGRRKFAGEVIPVPPPPTVISDSICGPGMVDLMASGVMNGTLIWYDQDSAGNELAKGSHFQPFVDRDTIFWVEDILRGCAGERSPVYVVVYTIPDPPVLIPDTLCGPGIVTLEAIDGTGLVRWFETDSATIAIDTGRSFSTFLATTTTFYATLTDEHCESPKRAVEAIIYPIPNPPMANAEFHVCGPDTVVFTAQSEGLGGELFWFDSPAGGTLLATGDIFKIFLERDQRVWLEEKRNGCIGARTQVEGLVNIIPDPPVTQDDWICDDGDATMGARALNRFIEWFDADSAGQRVNTGNSFTVFVTDTAFFWTQIPPAPIERLGAGDSSVGEGGMSDFFEDGLRFDVLEPTTLKQVTVYPLDSGLLNIRLLDRFGSVMLTHQEAVTGRGPVDVLLTFPILPGKGYQLDARGSTITGLFRNSTGFSLPDTAETLIITEAINAQSPFYYFFYDWKIGHCVSEQAEVKAISYPKATRSPIPPAEPASFIASYECEDPEGWTHYFFDAETPELEDDLLLFSIWKDGQNIGTVGDGTFRLRVHASDNAAGGGGVATSILAPYVSNADGWFVMNRYWDIVPNPAPSRAVKIRFYYNETDLMEVNNALMAIGDSIPITHQELNFFVIEDGSADPDQGHVNVGLRDYIQYQHGETSDNSTWLHDFRPPFHYGELTTTSLNGGGAGKGGNGKGALTTGELSLEPLGSHVKLNWEALSGFNGDLFEVEKSLDGEKFEVIADIPFINEVV